MKITVEYDPITDPKEQWFINVDKVNKSKISLTWSFCNITFRAAMRLLERFDFDVTCASTGIGYKFILK